MLIKVVAIGEITEDKKRITPHFRGNYITDFNRKEGGKMDYEKINKAIVEILEEKYGVKIESKIERK